MALNKYHRGFVYMCLGGMTELGFTAVKQFPILEGKTQLWVLLLYYFGSILWFEPTQKHLRRYHILIRAVLYSCTIMGIEYVAGFILHRLIGKCPWTYKNKYNVSGYINLAYAPLWSIVGLTGEYVHDHLNRIEYH